MRGNQQGAESRMFARISLVLLCVGLTWSTTRLVSGQQGKPHKDLSSLSVECRQKIDALDRGYAAKRSDLKARMGEYQRRKFSVSRQVKEIARKDRELKNSFKNAPSRLVSWDTAYKEQMGGLQQQIEALLSEKGRFEQEKLQLLEEYQQSKQLLLSECGW